MTDEATLARILEGVAARISGARWSGAKGAGALSVRGLFCLFEDGGAEFFAALFSFPPDGTGYFVPFVLSRKRSGGLRPLEAGGGLVLAEAETDRRFLDFTVASMRRRRRLAGRGLCLAWDGPSVPGGAIAEAARLGGDTTNVVVRFRLGNKRLVLKSYRTADAFNPEPELLSFLSSKGSRTVPRVLGTVRLVAAPAAGGARAFAPVEAGGPARRERPVVLGLLSELASGVPAFPAFVGNARRSVSRGLPPHDCIPARLGIAVGDLHHLLSTSGAPPDIRPEAISHDDIGRWRSLMRARFETAKGALSRDRIDSLVRCGGALERLLAGMDDWAGARKLRTHQDLHLGQVLISRGGFRILDFEGEPLRKGPQRIEKLPPERDVATMLRSFSYAAAVALRELNAAEGKDVQRALEWERGASASFVEGYLSACPRAVRQRGKRRLMAAVRAWMAEKALYEIAYEARFRPEWLDIPLMGLQRIFQDG